MNKQQYDYNSLTTPIGLTDWRNKRTPFGIRDKDRLGHIYSIGKTGVGKSSLLLNMAISDIKRGNGLCVIDPHGDVAETILNYVPEDRIDDVVYFNPGDIDHPIAFNPLRAIHPNFHHLVASGLISTFKRMWADSWGVRLEYILKYCLLTLLEYGDGTLLDIQSLLTDKSFRYHVLSRVKSPHTRAFWFDEFDKYTPTLRAEAISPILNKMGVFVSCLPLRNIVGQKTRGFRLQQIMDEKKILICNLSKGIIGEDASMLMGSVIINSIQLAALHRANIEESKRTPFYLYVDEAHSFLSLSFADILSESRKYGLSLFLCNQYCSQFSEKIRLAILGNVGTLISFRVGSVDAEILEKEFYPVFNSSDLINLPRYSMYLKLMIDSEPSKPFSALTLPVPKWTESFKEKVVLSSRKRFAKDRALVEQDIFRTYEQVGVEDQESLGF